MYVKALTTLVNETSTCGLKMVTTRIGNSTIALLIFLSFLINFKRVKKISSEL